MTAVRAVFGWIGRRAVLFALVLLALVLHQVLTRSAVSFRDLSATVAALEDGAADLPAFVASVVDGSNRRLAADHRAGVAALDARIRDATRARDAGVAACRANMAATFVRKGAAGVLDSRRACMTATIHDREIVALRVLRDTAAARLPGETLSAATRRHALTARRNAEANRAAVARIRDLEARSFAEYRFAEQLRTLRAQARTTRDGYLSAKRSGETLVAGQRRLASATARTQAAVAGLRRQLDGFVAEKREELGGTLVERGRGWAEWLGLDRLLRTAAIAFAAILLTPLLIRTAFYLLLAPVAARRPAIRLGEPGVAMPAAAPSTTSVGVRLAAGEELLVRQDYLQSTAHEGDKSTRWLLDWRHPLSSLAAGLWFLTRVRGEGALTTVSAVRDPFAEVTVIDLPQGSACVLQPRGLAAVVQPTGRPLRITRHWRLGSLHAWLTLQLRFLIFHGPARLVVKGGRGVRVEPAERGRVFGQDQLVGFSAGLAYTVARTETFWPYLFGREPLFRDRVAGEGGVLIVEEAPLAGRKGGVARGLEGAVDAALKVFGI